MPDPLLDNVRASCPAAIWSRGEGLARGATLLAERAVDDELVLRLVTQSGQRAPAVTLYLDDGSWECECGGDEDDCCTHVAATVIARAAAAERGQSLTTGQTATARLHYRFRRAGDGLALERVIVDGDRERLLEARLAVCKQVAATPRDERIDRILDGYRGGLLPRGMLQALLAALDSCESLQLDGRSVRVATRPVGAVVRVADEAEGIRLSVEQDPRIREIFANGVALCGDILQPIAEPPLNAREREELTRGLFFAAGDLTRLVTEILPSLRRRLPVDIQTRRLPGTTSAPPRIQVESRRERDALIVRADLVYGDPPSARIEGSTLVPIRGTLPLRDTAEEERLSRELRGRLGLRAGETVSVCGADALDLAERLRTWRGDIRGDAHERLRLGPPLEPRTNIEGDRFELRFTCAESAGENVAAPAVLRAWRSGESLIPLSDGRLAPLPEDWLARLGPRVADLLAARDREGRLPAALLPDLARFCEESGEAVPDTAAVLRQRLESRTEIPRISLPQPVRDALRPYQQRGVDWLCFLRDSGLGALLADDMGLGKTRQALAAAHGRTLVVSPTSVLPTWIDEARRLRPESAVALHHGAGRVLDPGAEITVTSWALLRLDVDVLAATAWDTVILDEAQAMKNPDSQVARAARRLRATFRVALTGTPVENRLAELWSQMDFLNPRLLGSREDFERRWARPIAGGDAATAARLRERIRPFVLRRLKQDVAPELPPRTDMVLYCDLSEEERALYEAVRLSTVPEVVERLSAGGSVVAALEALLRLRQAACHSGLLPGSETDASAKLDLLEEMLDEVIGEGHRALVFSQWTSLLDRVAPRLEGRGLAHLRLDGATRDRAGVVRRFQEEAGPPVMLVSLRAGGTGLTLTAADHVFLLDPWWNPAVEEQAADRTHRIGQERPVFVYRLVARDTVEERILLLQEHKRRLFEAALSGTAEAASLTREDLLRLLGD